jgi:dipeptidyl aminopeptidase/acylaminoacyl peptidase
VATEKRELIFSESGLWSIADHLDDSMLLRKATGSLTSEYYLWNESTKKLFPLLGQSEKEEYDVTFAGNVNEFIVQTPKFSDFRKLYLLKDGEFKPLTDNTEFDVNQFAIDSARTRIYYSVNDKGYSRIYVLDAKSFRPLDLPTFRDFDQISFGASSHDGRFVTISMSRHDTPRANFVFDWQTKKLTQWNLASQPEIDTKSFAQFSLESYDAQDGTKIPMLVRRPTHCLSKPNDCPVIVHFHGGPEGQSVPGFESRGQLFVDAGFIFIEPNVRGSDGYGKIWLNSDNGARRIKVITDIQDVVTFVKKNWPSSVERKFGVYGGSYGGYSTLMAMTYFAGTYDAGVSVVGISDLKSFLRNTAPYRRALRETEYGSLEKDSAALELLSPVTHLQKAAKYPNNSILLIQGANDPRVPVGEAYQMYNGLKKSGVNTDLVIFPDEGHGTSKRENTATSLTLTLDFFKRHLK